MKYEMRREGRAKLAVIIAGIALVLVGCSTPGFIHNVLPAVYDFNSYLVPGATPTGEEEYSANEDGSVTFDREGLRVTVRYLSDAELNDRYPDVSFQDRFSANPFTYGNWRDPHLGYTPNRFTVFEIEVYNPVLPKVELFPGQVGLRTSLGEEFIYYSINREDSDNSFEDFYTLIRGPGGNEQYRFDQRMSIVREELYRSERQVFKGGDYSGYLVFEALKPQVESVELHIDGFALQFDEANHPSQVTDLVFRFDRKADKRQLEGEEAVQARKRDWVLPAY
ncbi:MAG: hypothetical protein GKR89_10250 [Candidatus Latescibacteria bacterium]|nr:hypothetical protein [Candidatus Latescibacterota bacterium]